MIPVLYPATEHNFQNNGLGGLPDAISCYVTEKRNTPGGYFLEMEYPADGLHYSDIAPDRIIYAAPAPGKHPQPFYIQRIAPPIGGVVQIEAPHISAQLQKLVTYGTHSGTNIQGMIYNFLYQARQLGQVVDFWCTTDITRQSTTTFKRPQPSSIMDVLLGTEGSVLDIVGGEYEWDHWHVVLHRQRGTDAGLEVRYGVNMTDFNAETDASELVTAVLPYWKGKVNDVETFIYGDLCASSNASAYATVRAVPLDVSNKFDLAAGQSPTKAQVTAAGQSYISGANTALSTSISASFVPPTVGNRPVNLCDTLKVVYPDLNVSATAKVVETRFNVLADRYESITIGNFKKTIVDTIADIITKDRGGT